MLRGRVRKHQHVARTCPQSSAGMRANTPNTYTEKLGTDTRKCASMCGRRCIHTHARTTHTHFLFLSLSNTRATTHSMQHNTPESHRMGFSLLPKSVQEDHIEETSEAGPTSEGKEGLRKESLCFLVPKRKYCRFCWYILQESSRFSNSSQTFRILLRYGLGTFGIRFSSGVDTIQGYVGL